MKRNLLIGAFTALNFLSFQTQAQVKEYDSDAEIIKLGNLQWKVVWETCDFINPQQVILDEEYPEYCAYIEDKNDVKTYLYYKKQIIFPEYGNFFTVILEGMNLADGDYILTIPSDYVTLPGYLPNEFQQFYITIGDNFEVDHSVSFTELDGNMMNIYWNNVTTLSPGNTTGAYMTSVADNKKYDLFYLEGDQYSKANLRIENNFLRLNITNNYPDLPDGKYKLYLPENYVLFNGTSSGNASIEGYEFTYNVAWKEGPIEVNGPFEDGTITVKWTSASEIEWNLDYKGDGYGTNGICVWDSKDKQTDVPYPSNINIFGNVMTVSLNRLGINSGQCQLVIPEDCVIVTVNGESGFTKGTVYRFQYKNPDMEEDPNQETYEIYDGDAKWSISAGSTVVYGDNPIEISWPGTKISIVENRDDEVSVYSTQGNYQELTFGENVKISDDKTKLMVNLGNLESSVYRINIPEAYVYIEKDGDKFINEGTSLDNVTVDNSNAGGEGGVDTILSGTGLSTVFTLQGVKLKEIEKIEELQNLPKGIYIVGGKKIAN